MSSPSKVSPDSKTVKKGSEYSKKSGIALESLSGMEEPDVPGKVDTS